MEKPTFSIAYKDDEMLELINTTGHKALALWAIYCAKRGSAVF